MRPPQWALQGSTRLGLDGFSAMFSDAWSALTSRFLKLETWQTYQELDTTESQKAYESGDAQRARELLALEAEADRPLYEDIAKQGIDYARIRLIQEPLSPYLQYELISYRIRHAMGENIQIARIPAEVTLPNNDYFDFLLFDRHTALIHDYGDAGAQSGGWITHDTAAIDALEQTALKLRATAIPLQRFAQ
jgi:hypothetical protein